MKTVIRVFAIICSAMGLCALGIVPAAAQNPDYSAIIQHAAAYVASSQYNANDTAEGCSSSSNALGAIAANPIIPGSGYSGYVNPYGDNYGAFALILAGGPTYLNDAFNYIKWYLNNINWPASADTFQGVAGTIFDYTVNDGNCTQSDTTGISNCHDNAPPPCYDSSDAYAGTFLSLVNAFVRADPSEASYFTQSNPAYVLGVIATAVTATLNSDNLTSALKSAMPNGYVYDEDNIEASQGLADFSSLLYSEGNTQAGSYWAAVAGNMRTAIQNDIYDPAAQAYQDDPNDPSTATFNPCGNAMYQLWDVWDLQNTSSWRSYAVSTYNGDYPGWTGTTPGYPDISCPDHDPDGYVAYAAAQVGDYRLVNSWLDNTSWSSQGYPYPWTVQVSGWQALAAWITWNQTQYVI